MLPPKKAPFDPQQYPGRIPDTFVFKKRVDRPPSPPLPPPPVQPIQQPPQVPAPAHGGGLSFEEKQKIWHNTFYNPKTGYINATELWYKLPEEAKAGVQFFAQFKPWYDSQKAVQVGRIPRRFAGQKWNSVSAGHVMEKVQMDIIIYDRYTPLTGTPYRNILCMVDVHSRYAGARPLVSRDKSELFKAFLDILHDWRKGNPELINCDNEFKFEPFLSYFNKNHITPSFSFPDERNKNPIVERFNRTLASKLQRWRVATNRNDWPTVLQDIVENYNNTYHRTVKNKPIDIFQGVAQNRQIVNVLPVGFKEGDLVRYKLHRKAFDKGDRPYYSKPLVVAGKAVESNKGKSFNTRRYVLADPETFDIHERKQGPFKAYELHRIQNVDQYRQPHTTPMDTIDPAIQSTATSGHPQTEEANTSPAVPLTAKQNKKGLTLIQRVQKDAGLSTMEGLKRKRDKVAYDAKTGTATIKHDARLLPLHEKRQRRLPAHFEGFQMTATKKK